MGHNSETQPSDSMPQGVNLRGGKYYFRKRIPKEVRETPNSRYFQVNEYKKSLGTSDRSEARRQGANILAQLENEFAEILSNNSTVAKFATHAPSPHQARILSHHECQSIYLEEFKRLELLAVEEREKYDELDQFQKDHVRDNLIETLTGASREQEEGLISAFTEKELDRALRLYGSHRSQVSPKEWHSLANKFLLARLEVMNRSLAFLENREAKPLSQSFSQTTIDRYENDKTKSKGVSIERLCSSYLEDKKQSKVKPATLKKCEADTRLLLAFAGKSMMIEKMNFDKGKELIQFIGDIPSNRPSKFTLRQAVEKSDENTERISATTQRNYYNDISSIFRYAVDHQWLDKNPLNNKILFKQLPKKGNSSKQTQSGEDMNKILGSPKFLKERYRKSKEEGRSEGRFWSVLLAIFHGMRINEAAQLLVEDVKEFKGITYLAIREENDEGEIVKSLKTKVSKREIPLHQTILNLGFKEFVEHQRNRNCVTLFPELTANKIGNSGASVSKWFGRLKKEYLECSDLSNGDKGLHSFRHKVTDILRSNNVEDEMRYRICGWDRDMKKNSGFDYGGGLDLIGVLKENIDLIEFEGFDESLLIK